MLNLVKRDFIIFKKYYIGLLIYFTIFQFISFILIIIQRIDAWNVLSILKELSFYYIDICFVYLQPAIMLLLIYLFVQKDNFTHLLLAPKNKNKIYFGKLLSIMVFVLFSILLMIISMLIVLSIIQFGVFPGITDLLYINIYSEVLGSHDALYIPSIVMLAIPTLINFALISKKLKNIDTNKRYVFLFVTIVFYILLFSFLATISKSTTTFFINYLFATILMFVGNLFIFKRIEL